MYTEYAFYRDTYGGGLSEADYTKAANDADAIIEYLTFTNGDIFERIEEANVTKLKKACCVAADIVATMTATDGSGAQTAKSAIKSENTDGYSVTYASGSTDGETAEAALKRRIYEAIKVYLMPTGWLYRGAKVRWRGYDHEHESHCL